MELGRQARRALRRHQIEALRERIQAGGSATDHATLAFLLAQRQIDHPHPAGWSSVRDVIESGLLIYRDEPDLLFNLAFCWLSDDHRWKFARAHRRLARHDPIGAGILDAMVHKDSSIIDRLLTDCYRRSRALDADMAEAGMNDLARLHWLSPNTRTVAYIYGAALAERGDLADAVDVAASLARQARNDFQQHFNAGVLFRQAGATAHARHEFQESLFNAQSHDDCRSARHALDQLAGKPDEASTPTADGRLHEVRTLLVRLPFARVAEFEWRLAYASSLGLRQLDAELVKGAEAARLSGRRHEAELLGLVRDLASAERLGAERRAAELAAGVIDVSSFGAELGEQLDRYLAAGDVDAARSIIRAHPALLTPVVVKAVALSVDPSPSELYSGMALANLLADAEAVGLARASSMLDLGARERDRPPEHDVTLPAAGADPEAAITALRTVTCDPTFADLSRSARTELIADLGHRLFTRASTAGELDDLLDAVGLLRRATSASVTPENLLALGLAELELHIITRSDVALERARFLLYRVAGALDPDDPMLVQCFAARINVGVYRYRRYGRRDDLELALACAEHMVDALGGALSDVEATDDIGGPLGLALAGQRRVEQLIAEDDGLATVPGTVDGLPATDSGTELIAADGLVFFGLSVDVLWSAAEITTIDQVHRRMARMAPRLTPHGTVAILCEWAAAEAMWCRHQFDPSSRAVREAAARLAKLDPRDALVRSAVTLTHATLLAELGISDEQAWDRATAVFRELIAMPADVAPSTQWERRHRTSTRASRRWGDAAWRSGRWADAAAAYGALLDLRLDVFRNFLGHADQLYSLAGTAIAVSRATWSHLHLDDRWGAAVACERGRALLLTMAMAGRPLGDLATGPAELLLAIQDAAQGAPLVYLVTGEAGGVALVVDGGDLSVIDLPGLSDTAARAHVQDLVIDGPPGSRLLATTRWLWEAGIGRLADVVGVGAELTLIPSGVLSMLPLHAAWRPDETYPDGRCHLLDLTAVRYTPNARALNSARARLSDRGPGHRSALAVLSPAASRLSALPGATREVDLLAGLISTTRLEGARATRSGVLAAWNRHDVLHFACHARALAGEPLRSAILLAGDRPLEVADILDATTTGSPLVVLSACETAIVGEELPDETVSMQSAFLQTGAHGVIGSLWRVDDAATADLMGHFYRELSSGRRPIDALRGAQRAVREHDASTGTPARRDFGNAQEDAPPVGRDLTWMAFTYTGA